MNSWTKYQYAEDEDCGDTTAAAIIERQDRQGIYCYFCRTMKWSDRTFIRFTGYWRRPHGKRSRTVTINACFGCELERALFLLNYPVFMPYGAGGGELILTTRELLPRTDTRDGGPDAIRAAAPPSRASAHQKK